MTDIIVARATPPGVGGVAVIRASGPDAAQVILGLGATLPPPRQLALRLLRQGTHILDQAMVVWFPAPHSFTGEEVAELHCHGSPAVVEGVLAALTALPNVRLAQPGEFTRRALLNGRMTLTQVEGLADLIHAESTAQRNYALSQMLGDAQARFIDWRRRMLHVQALVTATIDFADEDIPALDAQIRAGLSSLRSEIGAALDPARDARPLREGFTIALVGAPNAGKSTLANALARREVAITSAIPGTTRDAIEVPLVIGGFAVTLVDLAGLRVTDDPIERLGVDKAHQRRRSADLRLLLDAPDAPLDPELRLGLDPLRDVVVQVKSDLSGVGISALTGAGLDGLLADLAGRLAQLAPSEAIVGRARHRHCLTEALAALDAAMLALDAEVVSLHLSTAARALSLLIGDSDVEAVLGAIFSEFCIGK